MGTFFILISVVCFGISNCLWVYPLKALSVWQVILCRSALSSLFFIILTLSIYQYCNDASLLLFWVKPFKIYDLIIAVAICVYSYFGLVCYNMALKHKTEVSVASPITSMSCVFGALTSFIIYHDDITLKFITGALFFLIAVFFIEKTKLSLKQFQFSKGVLFSLLAAFIWGGSFALFGIPIKHLGVSLFATVLELSVFSATLLIVLLGNQKLKFIQTSLFKKSNAAIILLSLLGFLGVLFFNLSTMYLPMSTISAYDILALIVSITFSAIVLKERLILKQYIALALVVMGLCILNF